MTYTRRYKHAKPKGDNFHGRRSHGSISGGNFNSHKRDQKIGKALDPNLFIRRAKKPEALKLIQEEPSGTFSTYNITDQLKRNIHNHGYKVPTPIQDRSIPEILLGRDIIGIANTGTGKTAAFLITLINKCSLDRNQRVLIVVPTRELAVQIADEHKALAAGTGLEAVATIGGTNIRKQTYALRKRPHFVIGTPGRIKDLIERRELNLNLFQNVVLDEVDRMVDIGFIRDIQYLISLLPKVRQSLFFSATVDARTQDIIHSFVSNPVKISIKQQDTAESVDQDIIKLNGNRSKIEVLHDLLIKPEFGKVIIFGRTKWGMEKLSQALSERGFRSVAIHGNKSQNQRQHALEAFREGTVNILIATDVASRGLDIEGVTHVINYDAPTSYDDYIHRIGRTGRAGKPGVALTFI